MKPIAAATNGLDANGNHREANLMEVSAKDPEAMASQTDPRRIKFGEHLRPAVLCRHASGRLGLFTGFSVVVHSTVHRHMMTERPTFQPLWCLAC